VIDSVVEGTQQVKKYKWVENVGEPWGKSPPTIEIVLDVSNCFILVVYFLIDAKKTSATEDELLAKFEKIMKEHNILE
jgi:hypothetical protein